MGSSTGGLGFGSTFNAPSFPSESSNQTLTAFGASSTLGFIPTTPTSSFSSSVFGQFTNHRSSSGFDGDDDAQSSPEITSTTNSPFLAPSTKTQPSLFGCAGSSAFGQKQNNQANPFSAPLFSSRSGQPPLGSQHGGSGIAPYAVTVKTEKASTQVSTYFMSISSMPVYDGKSHEELRWEDYQQRTRANPFSASPRSENGQPLLVSRHGGSRIARYISSKADGEGSAKMVSISAMPVYFAKSHEELKWEDYRLRTEGGNGFGSLNRNSNLSIPSPFSSGLAAPVTNQFPFPTENVCSSTLVEVPNLNRHQCTACGCIKMNVVDEPALGRVSSPLTEMHVSQGQAMSQLNTCQPKSDVNKEGAFFIPEDPHDIPRPVNHHPIPAREYK